MKTAFTDWNREYRLEVVPHFGAQPRTFVRIYTISVFDEGNASHGETRFSGKRTFSDDINFDFVFK